MWMLVGLCRGCGYVLAHLSKLILVPFPFFIVLLCAELRKNSVQHQSSILRLNQNAQAGRGLVSFHSLPRDQPYPVLHDQPYLLTDWWPYLSKDKERERLVWRQPLQWQQLTATTAATAAIDDTQQCIQTKQHNSRDESTRTTSKNVQGIMRMPTFTCKGCVTIAAEFKSWSKQYTVAVPGIIPPEVVDPWLT